MAKILDVAQYIFEYYYFISKEHIDELKLQKLLYFCQREKLALTDEPLFDEELEGWVHGPVSPLVRSYFDKDDGIMCDTDKLSEDDQFIVRNVVVQYGGIASWSLRELSHKEYSWQQSRVGLSVKQRGNRHLSVDDIRIDAKKVKPFDSDWGMYYDDFEDDEVD